MNINPLILVEQTSYVINKLNIRQSIGDIAKHKIVVFMWLIRSVIVYKSLTVIILLLQNGDQGSGHGQFSVKGVQSFYIFEYVRYIIIYNLFLQ
jgi:hypothetical protein